MFDTTEALGSNENTHGGRDVLIKGVTEVPSAIKEMAIETWNDPLPAAGDAAKTLGMAVGMGAALGAILPSRGPAAAITGIAFSIPLVVGGIGKLVNAYQAGEQPGADIDALGHQLARDAVGGGTHLALGFAGGYAGARVGSALATSETSVGMALQRGQRWVVRGENKALVGLSRTPDYLASKLPEPISSRFFGSRQTVGEGLAATPGSVGEAGIAPALAGDITFAAPTTGARAWFAGRNSATQNRVTQLTADGETLTMYRGSLHGHSRYSDGTGLPPEIYAKAKADGMDFYAITDHNHLAARAGIKPGDPRIGDQAGTPVLAENPISYAQTFADARAATVDGEFVGLVGVEMGTIGKVGGHSHGGGSKGFHDADGPGAPGGHSHGTPDEIKLPQLPGMTEPPVTGRVAEVAKTELPKVELPAVEVPPAQFIQGTDIPVPKVTDRALMTPKEQALADAAARDASHWGGVNHVNLFEVPTFFEAVRVPRPRTFADMLTGRQPEVVVKPPDVVKYNDGDYATMVRHLGQIRDTSGKTPIIQLNHPRYTEDWNVNLPTAARGRDYGIKSFKNRKEWQEQFGQHASQIEIVTGQAMNPHPVDVMKASDIAPINLAGYIDKGLRISPTYGRDDHFLLPGGRPAGTGIFARDLSRDALLDGMRARRTIASTNIKELNGHMTVNDKHAMGSILDQNAVHDLNFKMHFGGGQFHPEAQYKLNLWSDRRVGDGRLAKIIETRQVSGSDLINAGGVVPFNMAQHTLGNKSAWYIEVQRTNPISSHVDHMWTAPIWIEPLALGQHSVWTRGLVGAGAMLMP